MDKKVDRVVDKSQEERERMLELIREAEEAEKKMKVSVIQKEIPETLADRVLMIVNTILFTIMLALVVGQVFIRIQAPWTGITMGWTEEMARTLMVITTFIGAAIAMRRSEHIAIQTIVDRLKPKTRVIVELISLILALVFVFFATDGCYKMAVQMWDSPTASIRWIKIGQLYAIMMAAVILLGIYILRWFPVRIKELKEKTKGQSANNE
ncbi:MAG: TRAP transporter small permease [Dethiobacteria bacterium]